MGDLKHAADAQIDRINVRIAELAADYDRSQLARAAWLDAGDPRRASQLSARLHAINLELAYLAAQRTKWEMATENDFPAHLSKLTH